MNFTCDKNELNFALGKAARAVAQKSSIATLNGLLIEASNKISITGYDLRRGIFTSIDANIQKTGSVVLETKLFSEIIRRLPDGDVTISCGDDLMTTISCMKSEFKIMGMSAEDYPLLPDVDKRRSFSISQALIKKMISETLFAVSDNLARPVYTGALFDIENKALTIVAVDGFRLSQRKEEITECDISDTSFIVPAYALSDLEKICTDDEEAMMTISVEENHITFSFSDTVLISRRINGQFLNYKTSVPSEFTHEIGFRRTELSRVVDRVGLIVQEKIKSPLRFFFHSDFIKIICHTSIGNAEDICPSEGSGDDMEIGFNNRYMMDVLRHAPADELKMCINNGSSPAVILPADGSDKFKYMILPVRLRQE